MTTGSGFDQELEDFPTEASKEPVISPEELDELTKDAVGPVVVTPEDLAVLRVFGPGKDITRLDDENSEELEKALRDAGYSTKDIGTGK